MNWSPSTMRVGTLDYRWHVSAWNRRDGRWQDVGTFESMADACATADRYRQARIIDATNNTRVR